MPYVVTVQKKSTGKKISIIRICEVYIHPRVSIHADTLGTLDAEVGLLQTVEFQIADTDLLLISGRVAFGWLLVYLSMNGTCELMLEMWSMGMS